MSIKETIKTILVNKLNSDYEKSLLKKKISYDAYVRENARLEDGQESVQSKRDFIVFLMDGATLREGAMQEIARYMEENSKVMLAYGDEDVFENGRYHTPWYKPAWSPDLYLDMFYVGNVVILRKQVLDILGASVGKATENGEVYFHDLWQLRSIADHVVYALGGYEKKCESIGHIPKVLCAASDVKMQAACMKCSVMNDRPEADMQGLVSVVIPSKDNPAVLKTCLNSLKPLEGQIELIVVDNGSNEENKKKYESIVENADGRYIYEPMPFNFSKMCNMGAEAATGRFLLFLNDDMEMVGSEWLLAMKEKAAQSYVGAVGLKLYYPGSDRLQHAGIINLPVGPVHKMQFASDSADYYFGRNKYNHNCAAVTGACLMVERTKFTEVGGFPEELAVAYNDVALGFSLWEKGYANVVINHHYAYHHESLSRGDDMAPEKLGRLLAERAKLYEMHPTFASADPYYPEGLSVDGLDSRFVEKYKASKNSCQVVKTVIKPGKIVTQVREDRCVMVSAEICDNGVLRGYGVVLGDNNALYHRCLALRAKHAPNEIYWVKCDTMYRDDLEENMPDQVNVALSGFWVDLSKAGLPAGEYTIGVMAKHRIHGGMLLNYTGRDIVL